MLRLFRFAISAHEFFSCSDTGKDTGKDRHEDAVTLGESAAPSYWPVKRSIEVSKCRCENFEHCHSGHDEVVSRNPGVNNGSCKGDDLKRGVRGGTQRKTKRIGGITVPVKTVKAN